MLITNQRLVGAIAGLVGVVLLPQTATAHGNSTLPEPAVVGTLDACPVAGASNFDDSWGDPRSSGREHAGVDMAADRGTPVVAVLDGDAEFKRSNLGGNAVWLTTSAGERFYYAHLDAWEGSSRTVRAGEVIGYVGQSGNAVGDHLHFETRAGEVAENPYPHVDDACRPVSSPRSTPTPVRPILR